MATGSKPIQPSTPLISSDEEGDEEDKGLKLAQDNLANAEARQDRLEADQRQREKNSQYYARRVAELTDGSYRKISRRGIRQHGMSTKRASVMALRELEDRRDRSSTASVGNGGGGKEIDPYRPTGSTFTGMDGRSFTFRTEDERMARLMDSPLYRGKNDAERLQSFKNRQSNVTTDGGGREIDPYKPTGATFVGADGRSFTFRTEDERMARLMDSPLYRGKNDAERLQSFKDRQINDASQTDVKDSLTSGAEAGSAGNLRIDDKNPFKGPQKGAMPHPDSTLDPLPPGSQGRPLAALDKENTKKVGRG